MHDYGLYLHMLGDDISEYLLFYSARHDLCHGTGCVSLLYVCVWSQIFIWVLHYVCVRCWVWVIRYTVPIIPSKYNRREFYNFPVYMRQKALKILSNLNSIFFWNNWQLFDILKMKLTRDCNSIVRMYETRS